MEITEVRINLGNRSTDRLKAYCSITFDSVFVVRDVKIVEGTHGLFVAMPSRKLAGACPKCRYSNPVRARFCNACGAKLTVREIPVADGRTRLHRDIAHPITPSFREHVQDRVLAAFEAEKERAKDPEYAPPSLESEVEAEAEAETKTKTETKTETETETETDTETKTKTGTETKTETGAETGAEAEAGTDAAPYEPSEYEAMIADLRGGGGDSAQAGGGRTRSATERPRDGDGARGGRRRRGSGGRGPRSAREAAEADAPGSRPPAPSTTEETPEPAPTLAPRPEAAPSVLAGKQPSSTGSRRGKTAIKQEPPADHSTADRTDLAEATAEPAGEDDSCGDTSAFGAGIQ